MDTHLVLKRSTVHTITRVFLAISIGQEFGNDEQGNAFGARGGIGEARQNDVNDILGHVVLAGRDEYLGTVELVATVSMRLCLGAQHAQISATMGFGQTHGAGPLT